MKTLQEISVFISSPSDVAKERDIVAEVISSINAIKGKSLGYAFSAIRWENDVLPTFGKDPQTLIDESVGNTYDVFIGIMSTKFGTPTTKAGSGTEHEFNSAYSRKVEDPDSIEIMFYFQDVGHSGRKVDFKELEKIEKFKEKISPDGLYAPYTTLKDFETQVTGHLAKLMDVVIAKSTEARITEGRKVANSAPKGMLFDPLSFFDSIDDEEEIGFLDLADDAFDAMNGATEQLYAISSAITRLREDTSNHTASLNGNPMGLTPDRVKVVYKESARSMDNFVETSLAILPLFRKHLTEGLQLSRELIIVASKESLATENEVIEFVDALNQMKAGMISGMTGINGLSETISTLPRATTTFNRSKKRLKAVIDGIGNLIESAISEVDDIVEAIET